MRKAHNTQLEGKNHATMKHTRIRRSYCLKVERLYVNICPLDENWRKPAARIEKHWMAKKDWGCVREEARKRFKFRLRLQPTATPFNNFSHVKRNASFTTWEKGR